MEDLSTVDNYNPIVMKAEVEETGENYNPDAKFILSAIKGSNMSETETNSMDVKLESGTVQENEMLLLANNCKPDRSYFVFNENIKPEKSSNTIPVLDDIDSSTIKMEDYSTVIGDNHQIFIKTEVETANENNYDKDANSYVFPADKTDKNLIEVKLKFETKQEDGNEELVSANKYKFEMEVETYDEFYSKDVGSIHSEKNNKSIIRGEKTTNGRFGTKTQQNSGCEKNLYKKCDKCDFITKYSCALKLHQKMKHSDVRPYKCDKCDYTAKILSNLKKHQLKHSEVRPFKCDDCSYQAKSKDLLKEHRLRHTELRPFKCDKCDYSAKNGKDLNGHQKRHSEMVTFKCDQCEYTTNYNYNLTKHKVMHLEPTIQCDQCDYKARTLVYFKQHQLIHKDISEVETFKCYLCDYKAKRKRDLKRHITARHRKIMKI